MFENNAALKVSYGVRLGTQIGKSLEKLQASLDQTHMDDAMLSWYHAREARLEAARLRELLHSLEFHFKQTLPEIDAAGAGQ